MRTEESRGKKNMNDNFDFVIELTSVIKLAIFEYNTSMEKELL